MSAKPRHVCLASSVKILKLMNMWPENKETFCSAIKRYWYTVTLTVSAIPIFADQVILFQEETLSFDAINENFVGLSSLLGIIYVSILFNKKRDKIRHLVNEFNKFESFSPKSLILETERFVDFYTKLFTIYGVIGNVCYAVLPVLNYAKCENNRLPHMDKYGIPCGLIIRFSLPFRIDYTPVKEFVAVYELVITTLGSTITIVVTMLVSGVIIHITAQLKHLKSKILELSSVDAQELEQRVKFCVKFHIAIVDYATRTDHTFNAIMLLHITWTGFVISVLGFQITTSTDVIEAVRFGMHLAGWLAILFVVCYFGQALMDESVAIADAIYAVSWYNMPVSLQKYVILVLARSQRPLTLKACGLQTMSLATFLAVLYSAYSYFTLLLKLQP